MFIVLFDAILSMLGFLVAYLSICCFQIADGLLDKNGKPNEKTPSEWYRAAMKTPESNTEGKYSLT